MFPVIRTIRFNRSLKILMPFWWFTSLDDSPVKLSFTDSANILKCFLKQIETFLSSSIHLVHAAITTKLLYVDRCRLRNVA